LDLEANRSDARRTCPRQERMAIPHRHKEILLTVVSLGPE
jgi:hypothetical protein